MAKLKAKDYKTIIARTLAGDSRSAISIDLPVDRRRVSKFLCDVVDGCLTDCLYEALKDDLTPEVIEQLKKKQPVGRSRKHDFISVAKRESKSDEEYERVMKAWQHGYATGYNLGRAKEE